MRLRLIGKILGFLSLILILVPLVDHFSNLSFSSSQHLLDPFELIAPPHIPFQEIQDDLYNDPSKPPKPRMT